MLDRSVLTPTWMVAVAMAQKGETTYKRGGNWLRPWRWFKLRKDWSITDVAEVVALKEDHTFDPRVVFNTVLRMKDGRHVFASSLCNTTTGGWQGKQYVAWSLKALMQNAMTPQTIESLKLMDKLVAKKPAKAAKVAAKTA